MSNIFTEVELTKVPSNSFNLSHDHKLTLKMGLLIPFNIMECIPGDQINGNSVAFMRMMPMLAPIMHKVNVDIHHFFVPNRLVWPNWEKFITAGVPNEETPAHPYLAEFIVEESSLFDYAGLPLTGGILDPDVKPIDKCNALPFAAYNKIYNDYFRDQNLQDPEIDVLTDGLNTTDGFGSLHRRAWQHDYFTSALPWAQKGEAVALPIGTTAPLIYDPVLGSTVAQSMGTGGIPGTWPNDLNLIGQQNPGGAVPSKTNIISATEELVNFDVTANTVADLSNASAVTINALRWAVRLQEFLERNARGGTRYIENILAHFNVRSSDKRLQRPEFLGGSSNPMVISEVLQNAPATDAMDTPQGNMSGHGLSVGRSRKVNYFVEEHGFFFSIMSVRPTTAYQQGIPRQFSKFDPLDYAWPTFANVGEQAIKNRELYYRNNADDDLPFGYIPRYAEYKYQPSKVSGAFQTSLAFWHLGRIFDSPPNLASDFITCDPSNRIFAVETPTDNLIAHINQDIRFRRRLPRFGIPTL